MVGNVWICDLIGRQHHMTVPRGAEQLKSRFQTAVRLYVYCLYGKRLDVLISRICAVH